jgi:hypothetical protein
VAVGSGETFQVGDRFDVPNNDVAHVGTLPLTTNRAQSE